MEKKMRKFFENKLVYGVILSLFALAFGWNTCQGAAVPATRLVMETLPMLAHGPMVPPDPWDSRALKHGPMVPPDPWDSLALMHGPMVPPDPWDSLALMHGPMVPPDPWDSLA
jgi:hypothetical protein